MTAEKKVFAHYTREALDFEYDNVNKVMGFDFQAYLKTLGEKNQSALTQYEDVLRRDLSFGPHEDETLDLFLTNPGGPLHVFFHGGYWRMLHKDDFPYIAHGVLPHGHNLAVINYSLIPTVRMDELVGQCRRSIEWLMENAAELNIDPKQVSVSGHSAGGHLAAMMCTYEFPQPLTSVCALSGIFDLRPIQKCFLNDVLSLTDEEVQEYSPMQLKPVHQGPLLLLTGALEGPEYERQARELQQAWSAYREAPEVLFATDHDHFTLRADLGDPKSEITRRTLFL